MKMYVANCTNQTQEFQFRLPGSARVYHQPIHIGAQTFISGSLQPEDVDAIVVQHEIYGLCDAKAISQTRRYINLLFSIDRAVTASQIAQAHERNRQIMNESGIELRKAAAVAVGDGIQGRQPNDYRGLNIEVREQARDDGLDPTFVESMHVERRANGPGEAPTQKRRGRRAA